MPGLSVSVTQLDTCRPCEEISAAGAGTSVCGATREPALERKGQAADRRSPRANTTATSGVADRRPAAARPQSPMLPRHQTRSSPSPPRPAAARSASCASPGATCAPLIAALCGRGAGAAPRHLPAVPRPPTAQPIDQAWRSTSRRRIRTPAKTCSSCRRTAAPVVLQLLLARCLEAAAEPTRDGRPRLPACAWPSRANSPSAPSSTASSTWRRPRPSPT